MTGNLVLDLAISLAGIIFLVALSWRLGALENAPVTELAAAGRAALDEPDFEPAEWAVDTAGRAAIAVSKDSREVVIVFRVGDRIASRRFPARALSAEADGDRLVIRLNDFSKRRVILTLKPAGSASRWLGVFASAD